MYKCQPLDPAATHYFLQPMIFYKVVFLTLQSYIKNKYKHQMQIQGGCGKVKKVPLVIGGNNLLSPLGIRLTDRQKLGYRQPWHQRYWHP